MFQLKFDDIVHTPKEIEALSFEEFSFTNLGVVEESSVRSDDDFKNPPNRPSIPKAVSPSVHKSKVGQQSSLSLKPLIDWVNVIDKNKQMLAKEQKNMIKQMSTMKTEMSSKLSAILTILTNLQGGRTIRVKD